MIELRLLTWLLILLKRWAKALSLQAWEILRRMRHLIALLFLLTSVVPGAAQQLDANNWGKGTAGVMLVAHEEPRQHTAKGTILWYNLIGKGFPEGVVYTLWRWLPEKSPEPVIKGVSFDKRGVLVCSGRPGYCKGDGPDDPINIKTTAMLGEMKRLAVVSEDSKIVAFADAVPFPIEASDKSCKLSVVRMSALADTVVVRATGLKANQALTVTTRYGDEGATTKSNSAVQDGTWHEVVTAAGTKQPSGKALIAVSDGVCTVSVTFDYGLGSNKPQ